jgi:hypothetical protein
MYLVAVGESEFLRALFHSFQIDNLKSASHFSEVLSKYKSKLELVEMVEKLENFGVLGDSWIELLGVT